MFYWHIFHLSKVILSEEKLHRVCGLRLDPILPVRSAADKKFCLRLTVVKNALGKGKGVSITESLTSFRLKKLEETRVKYGFKNVWTIDGCIMFKDANGKPSVYYG